MKTPRLSRSFSRFALLPAVMIAAAGAPACSQGRGQPSASETSPAQVAQAQAVEHAEDPAEAASAHPDWGGRHDSARALPWLRQMDALDLRPEQRAEVEQTVEDLRADLQPSRAALKTLIALYASGVEAGKVDHAAIDAQRTVLVSSAPAVKAALEDAANSVHDILDEDQRAELVATMRARRAEGHDRARRHERPESMEHAQHHGHGPLAKLAGELGLNEQQKRVIRDAVRDGVDTLFPHRKEKRDEMEAKMKAMEDAFLTDDFDASEFDMGKDMPEMLKGVGDGATGLADLAVRVLSDEQRASVATKIRARTAKL